LPWSLRWAKALPLAAMLRTISADAIILVFIVLPLDVTVGLQ
jgi:hypothetical protein